MKDEFLPYIRDIVDAMIKSQTFIRGMDYSTFEQDEKTVCAVIRALEIIGEASKRVPQIIRQQHPDLSWRAMAGMRDKLIHAYDNVNLELVWKTVSQQIPKILPLVEKILRAHLPESKENL